MNGRQRTIFVLLFLSCLAYSWLAISWTFEEVRFIERHSPVFLSLAFVAFASYLFLIRVGSAWKHCISAAFLFRILFLFCLPVLSDDYLRFYWDGQILAAGFNPFLGTPTEMLEAMPELKEWWQLLNSRDYYSVYPPVCQVINWLALKLGGGTLKGFVLAMKLLVLGAEVATILLLQAILKLKELNPKLVLIYALNPLIILEFSSSLHFEVFAILFVVAGIYFFLLNRAILVGAMMSMAFMTKLWPLIFLPPFLIQLSWRKSLYAFSAFSVLTFLLSLPFYEPEVFGNVTESLKLYYGLFEFNGSIYQLARWLGLTMTGYNQIEIIGKLMFAGSFLGVLMIWWYQGRKPGNLANTLLLLAAVYFLFATTVHPWYIGLLVPLAVLSGYRFPVLWSGLILFTYLNYGNQPFHESTWIAVAEYGAIFSLFALESEIISKGFRMNLQIWWARRRAGIKLSKLQKMDFGKREILDVGTGNGAVAHGLKNRDIQISTLDVVDKSLFANVNPSLFDGATFPFEDESFDTVLMLTMLHHTKEPEEILREGIRVSRSRLIVMEDIYSNRFQKYLTFFTDSLVNLEFFDHPHTNKTDSEWKKLFQNMNLEVERTERFRTFLFFRQVIYVLKKKA